MGLEVNSKVVPVPESEYQVELFLYDVGGAKHFEEMRPMIVLLFFF
jgi:hypothetical protein